ncbi:zinc-dependent alcohol dehydrogenase family protein [Paenibacillus sp. TRM 82003]|nr:zinc-dependent alcohol dehydrogenase family protein [Paenibacillus sp. TRM 82003]
MKAAVLEKVGRMTVQERDVPAIRPDEVLVRVKACGICGTDQHIYHGKPGSANANPPIVLGHELSGVVESVGKNVTTLSAGDRVSIDPNIYCGVCRYCRDGRIQLCTQLQAVGVTRDGGMGELCVVPELNCYAIPDEITYTEAALAEPLGCVLHGFRKLTVSPNDTVLIIGGGFIGMLFLQLVRSYGASRIVVSEPAVGKHETLRQLGADETVNPLEDGAEAALASTADVVIECVGRPETMEFAVNAAAKGGQVLLFGVASPDTSTSVKPFDMFSKELRIMGSFINPNTQAEALALIANKTVAVEPLITHRFRLDDVPNAMETYPSMKVGKGIIEFL